MRKREGVKGELFILVQQFVLYVWINKTTASAVGVERQIVNLTTSYQASDYYFLNSPLQRRQIVKLMTPYHVSVLLLSSPPL